MHDTPSSTVNGALIGLGLGRVDQLVPFHFAVVVWTPLSERSNAELVARPTAMQLFLELHDTARNWLLVAPGFGLARMTHFLPVHRSTRVMDAPDSSGA